MAFWANANGQRIVDGSITLPYYGCAVADLVLATDSIVRSPVTVTVGNLTLRMALAGEAKGATVQRAFAGQTSVRLIGGAGGWPQPHKLSPYARPTGVMLSMVLKDLAAGAVNPVSGQAETVALATGADRSLGLYFVPDPGAGCARILRQIASPGGSGALWWVDNAGVTQVGYTNRPAVTITSEARIERFDARKSRLTIATEDIAAWVPGAFYASPTLSAGITVGSSRVAIYPDGNVRVEVISL
jgi:hypothetical protein